MRERRSHLLVSGAQDHAIYMMDPQGTIMTWNSGVERVLGYQEEEWVGQSTSVIFTPEDRASGEDRRELENAAENGRAEDIRWHVRRDGSRIWVDGVVTPLYDGTGTLVGFCKVMRDATDRKRAQTALRDAEERLRLAAEATGVGTFDFDPVSGELRWDERCKAMFGLPPDTPVDYGVFLSVTHPEDRERAHAVVQRALDPASGAEGEYEVEFRTTDLTSNAVHRWVLARGRAYFDPERTRAVRFVGTVIDITERKRAEDALRASADALRASEERYRTLFDSIDEGFCVIEVLFEDEGHHPRAVDYRFLEVNPAFERHTGLVDAIGRSIRELVPDLDEFWFETYGRVALTGEPARFESHAPAMGRWFDVYALRVGAPEERRVGLLFTDMTARKAEQDALRTSEVRLASVIGTAMDGILIAGEDQRIVSANPAALEMFGYAESDVVGQALDVLMPERFRAAHGGHIRRFGESGLTRRTRESFGVLTARRNDGSEFPIEASVSRFQDSGGRTLFAAFIRDISERVRAEAALRETAEWLREALAREHARAEREALLNQIADGIRQSLPPEQIEALAVAALGKALAADRCYVFTVDPRHEALVVARDWHAEGLPSMEGQYRLSEIGMDVDAVFGSGETLVVPDVQGGGGRLSETNAMVNQGLRISSLVNVPFYEGGRFVGALAVAMASGARQWTAEEVVLTETVAGQLRSTVETARLQQRERNIAQQLQEALQPAPPPNLPGLAMASFYRPALQEAGVGGDGFDVFAVEKSCTALCVFDLSGKGLKAAGAVATVRNMARFALYNAPSVSEAVTSLHRTLVEHDLLGGFATLFLGVYDHNQRTLTYVNAGQEPGLIWRAATGEVEQLPPTGPVLGGFDGSFTETLVSLGPGDVFAAFTDGMTDVGPSRRHLLGVEGVADLMRGCCRSEDSRASASSDPRAIVNCLMAGVDAFGQGRTGDDIALLVGVVT